MGKKSKAPPAPINPLSIARPQSKQLLNYYRTEVPQWLQLQNQFGPKFMGQMLGQTGQFLTGAGGQPGLQALQLSAGQEAGKTLGQLRAEEVAQMTGQTGAVRGLFEQMAPESAAQLRAAAQAASDAYARAQSLNPQEQRTVQQQAREAFGQRGMLGSTGAVAAEVLNRENYLAQKRDEAASRGREAFNLAQNFYTAPGLELLSKAPTSYGAGLGALQTAMAAGPASSGQFDYNMPLSFAQGQSAGLNQYNMEKYKSDQQSKAARLGMIGQVAGLALAPFTGGLSAGLGLGSASGMLGSTGFNLGAGAFNLGAGALGAPLKATIV